VDDPISTATLTRDSRNEPRKILIVRLGAMGDVIHALPAVGRIREAIPDCEIGWVIERRWVPLLCAPGSLLAGGRSPARPLVDTVHVVDTRAWRKSILSSETFRAVSAVRSEMRARQYDVAIDFQGAIKSAVLARMSGAREIVGFQQPRESAAAMFYTRKIATSQTHVVEQNLELVRSVVGDSRADSKVSLPMDGASDAWVIEQLRELGISKFAILAPTAGWKAKEWSAANFGVVASALSKSGIASLINFGPGEENVAEEVRAASGGTAIPFACDLSQLIGLTRRASLFVGGDTGPMHLAAALNVPVVALFGPTDPARNGPYSTRATVLRSAKSITSYSHVATRDEGLADISPDEVISAAAALLNGSKD
jgi:heptosyltransferase I